MSKIVIHSRATDEVVHEIDTTGRSERELDRIERGLAMQFDFERYSYEVVTDA